jgi:hypothetical protein
VIEETSFTVEAKYQTYTIGLAAVFGINFDEETRATVFLWVTFHPQPELTQIQSHVVTVTFSSKVFIPHLLRELSFRVVAGDDAHSYFLYDVRFCHGPGNRCGVTKVRAISGCPKTLT